MHTCFNGKTIVVGIERFRNNHFIPGVKAGHKPEKDSFAASCGNDDLVMINFNTMFPVIINQAPPVAFIPALWLYSVL